MAQISDQRKQRKINHNTGEFAHVVEMDQMTLQALEESAQYSRKCSLESNSRSQEW